MGVSHASLEAIKAKTKSSPYGLSTKLTGAGGGGCAVTLVPDGKMLDYSTTYRELIKTIHLMQTLKTRLFRISLGH